jgi:anaerobic selenocysteine-containing dehydrogenase
MLTFDAVTSYNGSSKCCERKVRTVCRECTVGCGLWAFVQENRIVDIKGDLLHPWRVTIN